MTSDGTEEVGGAFQVEVKAVQERLRARAKLLAAAASALRPLTKASLYADRKKLGAALSKAEERIPAEQREKAGLSDLLLRLRQWLDEAGDRLRRRLGRELKDACEAAGLTFRVVSKEEPVEVRIPPFAVVFDFEKGQAELRFAKLEVARCVAEAGAILAAHERARKALDSDLDPARFFERCHRAWKAARAAKGEASERVEILDFLPYLAVEMQDSRFRVDPTQRNFRAYSRARFAFDVLRLRRQRMLTHNGLRLNFGVATGTTASEKKRVIYLEDEEGNGEYKLTIFFARTEEGGP